MVFRRAFVRKTCLPPSCTLRGQKLVSEVDFGGRFFEVDASIWGRIFGYRVENFGPKNGSRHRFREKKSFFSVAWGYLGFLVRKNEIWAPRGGIRGDHFWGPGGGSGRKKKILSSKKNSIVEKKFCRRKKNSVVVEKKNSVVRKKFWVAGRNFWSRLDFLGSRGRKKLVQKNGCVTVFVKKKSFFSVAWGVPRIFGPKKRNLGSTRGDTGRPFLGSQDRIFGPRGRVGPRLVGLGHFWGPEIVGSTLERGPPAGCCTEVGG